ncbi:secreted protein containing C-type lectin domain protein [Candidatus Magnetobacterium bavaricum]|uniref:Secreted protein containing C-type lectin domain protein n=1 Tax=Candidatus Magnetobacterium bavaricum TaxID=29290 RepID=A0A0F3H4E0_9BACT|nr:secreted protein containing C-type lectin domain protein [Candidatus Magnetobacterium bavaricum]
MLAKLIRRCVVMLMLCFTVGISTLAFANLVSDKVFELKQPDGSIIMVVNRGDESLSWLETTKGYTIEKGNDGYWYYVTEYNTSSKPVLSLMRAHEEPVGLSKHIRIRMSKENIKAQKEKAQRSMEEAPRGEFTGNVLYILVQFRPDRDEEQDTLGTYTETDYANKLSNNNTADPRSVAHYYNTVSNGYVTVRPARETWGVNGDNNGVVGWIDLPYAHPDPIDASDPNHVSSWKWNPLNKYYYKLSGDCEWDKCRRELDAENAQFVSIRNAEENDWLLKEFPEGHFWIGLNDAAQEGTYVWVGGQNYEYRNWNTGEPNGGADEDCVIMHNSDTAGDPVTAGSWRDVPCTHSHQAIMMKQDGGDAVVAKNHKIASSAIKGAEVHVDFKQYDTNGDGILSTSELSIAVVVAGFDTSCQGKVNRPYAPSVWPHKGDLSTPVIVDGVKVSEYLMLGDRCRIIGSATVNMPQIGVMAHELGHLMFGLPDLYDFDQSSIGLGFYCLMASGDSGRAEGDTVSGQTPVMPSAWVRASLGWEGVDQTPAIDTKFIAIGADRAPRNPNETRIYKAKTSKEKEYFLVENRQLQGYDKGLRKWLGSFGGGLAIYHVDDSMSLNNDETHRLVDLVEADGKEDNNATDLWYRGNKTNFVTSKLYDGSASGVSITDISKSDTVMTADTATDTAGWAKNPSNGYLYKELIDGCTWDDCERAAKAAGAHLVSIGDAQENQWLFETFFGNSYWIGLNDMANEGKYVWSDGKNYTYMNWDKNEPNGGRSENCLVMYNIQNNDQNTARDFWVVPGSWNDASCENTNKAIMKKKDTTGWVQNPSNGYLYKELIDGCTWDDCERAAEAEGAQLVSIRDAQENRWLFEEFSGHHWIGLNDKANEGKYVWSGGKNYTYTNWDEGEPNGSSSENCVVMFNTTNEPVTPGSWNDGPCEHKNKAIIKKRNTTGWVRNPSNGSLYKELIDGCIWDDCERAAKAEGAQLVSIRDAQENRWLFEEFSGHHWIGLNDKANEGKYVWSGGKNYTYTNWDEGEPNGGSSENCVVMFNTTNEPVRPGSWNDGPCGNKSKAIIEKQDTADWTTNQSNGSLYKVISGCTWLGCEEAAKAAGAHLVTIRNAEENQWLFDYAFGNHYWIGLNLGVLETVIFQESSGYTWSSDQKSTYRNWNTGEPNGGTTEACVMMYNTTNEPVTPGSWNDDKCTATRAGIIEKSQSDSFVINASVSGGIGTGTIVCTPYIVKRNKSSICTIKPSSGYYLSVLTDNGSIVTVTGDISGTSTYEFANVQESHDVVATFRVDQPKKYTVNSSAGPNGNITPSGTQTVNDGDILDFTVTPDDNRYYTPSVVGCSGTLSGDKYKTAPIKNNCDVTATFTSIPPYTGKKARYDFDSDGKSEILWQHNRGAGAAVTWSLDKGSFQRTHRDVIEKEMPKEWQILVVEDFNGDGASDILWKNDTSGGWYIWIMKNMKHTISSRYLIEPTPSVPNPNPQPTWQIEKFGDFNKDATVDILWRHQASGEVMVWLLDPNDSSKTTTYTLEPVSADWQVLAVADFNGDGMADILWKHTDGNVAVWIMQVQPTPPTKSFVVGGKVSPDWQFKSVGDFDGDGKADILWQHSDPSGKIAIWKMDGDKADKRFVIGGEVSDWQLKSIGDFNGDGKEDVFWQHPDGTVAVWIMKDAETFQAKALVNNPESLEWDVK